MRLVGVTELQGFFFSHAVAAEQIDALIADFDAAVAANASDEPAALADLRAKLRS
jgi:hypothetical protein